ncbi:MAG: hypothetical protein ACUZ9M_00515 [Candidatus Scalindua sp.]
MKVGQKIECLIYDKLFKDHITLTGTLINRIHGKLWMIRPDKNERLRGEVMQIHESQILV